MDKNIEKILNDIYLIDENLKEKEADLVKIIEELLKSKPDVKIDHEFMVKLKKELMELTGSEKKVSAENYAGIFGFRSRLSYAVFGAVLAVLILSPVFLLRNIQEDGGTLKNAGRQQKEKSSMIAKIEDGAFGSFSASELNNKSSMSSPAYGRGVGGGGGLATGSAESASASDKIAMPVYETTNYRYIYKGEPINGPENTSAVYARVKNGQLGNDLAGMLKNADISFLDMSKLSDLKVNNVTFSEDREYGYEVNLSPLEGMASIYMNWMKWPDPYASCRDTACQDINLKVSDIPEDSEIISIADSFLSEYGISISSFGSGKVMKSYMDAYPRPLDIGEVYVSDNITVVYPLKIEGKNVYDSSGELDGIFVDVNIRYNKASGLRSIYFQNFQSSAYETETDTDRILSVAQRGGLYGDYVFENAAKTVDIELGTPSLELVKIWKYNEKERIGQEFYVPSYIFPILNKPDGYYFRKNVIVPAIKDMLNDPAEQAIPATEPYILKQSR